MKADQKAVIQSAARKGLAPSEVAAELLTHDLLNSALAQMRSHAVAFKNMSEQQQDACIQTMQDEFKKAVDTAVHIIAGAGTKTVRMRLKKVAIGTNYQIQGVAGSEEEHLHALCDKAQDQSDVLIVLYESDYHQALDNIQGEKDQKDLPLDGEKAEKKPRASKAKAAGEIAKAIELPPALVDAARKFVVEFQNGTIAGLQNQLKIGMDKAKALHDVLAAEGLLTEEANERGDRRLVRKDQPDTAAAVEQQPSNPAIDVSDELYVKAKTTVIADRRVSTSFLAGILPDADMDTLKAIIDRLEADGVISEENELGGRAILIEA